MRINKNTLLPCKALIVPKHPQKRQRHDRRNNGKRTKRPPPASRFIKALRRRSASESRHNKWTIRKREHQTPPLQAGGVSDEDIEDVGDAVEADPVEDLGRGVRLDVVACGHHDQADDGADEHGDESLRPAPDVH